MTMTVQPHDAKRAAKARAHEAKVMRKAAKKEGHRIVLEGNNVWITLAGRRLQGGSIWGVRCTVHAGGNVTTSPSAAGILCFGLLGLGIRNVHDNRTAVMVFEGPAFTFTYTDRGSPARAYTFAAEFNRRARAYDGLPR